MLQKGGINITPTLPAYRLCTAAGAGAGAVTSWCRVRTAGSTLATSRARQEKAQAPVPIRDKVVLHISSRHVLTPDDQTTLHFRARFTKRLFVVFMSPPIWSEQGMELHMPLLPAPCAPATNSCTRNDMFARLPSYIRLLLPGAVWVDPTVTCDLLYLCADATDDPLTAVCVEIRLSTITNNIDTRWF